MIRGAPISFTIVCIVMFGIFYGCFHLVYKGKLDDAHQQTADWQQTAQRWQSDAEYYKELTSRPVQSEALPPKPTVPKPKDSDTGQVATKKETPQKTQRPDKSSVKSSTGIEAPNGIAMGGNNNGTAIVNNGSIPRTLTAAQQLTITSTVGAQSPNFDGITCLMGDQEGCGFATQIMDSLRSAGWQIRGLNQALLSNHLEGLFVVISPEDAATPPDGVMRLYNALRSAGLPVQGLRMKGTKGKFGLLVAAHTQPN